MNKKIKEIENNLRFQHDKNELPPSDVVAYNELRSCSDLFRMYNEGHLDIQPDFQRNEIWNDSDKTRFIDSLTKHLPIPSMCFSLDFKTQKWQVVDGLQRMLSIIKFFKENDWKLSKLDDIDECIKDRTPSYIEEHLPEIYRKIENYTIPVTVIRIDFSKSNHLEYLFMIFRRLNEKGYRLNNQEIRNAIYQGPFNTFLKECDENQIWRDIIGTKKKNDRYKRVELILRHFAFRDNLRFYKGLLSSFLNDYMENKRFASDLEIRKKTDQFNSIVDLIASGSLEEKPLYKLSNTVLDSVLYGIAENIKNYKSLKNGIIDEKINQLLLQKQFQTEYLSEGTMKKDKVIERFKVAKNIFKK